MRTRLTGSAGPQLPPAPAGPGVPLGIRGLLAAGPFRRLLVGQAVSSLGDWVGTFAFIAAALELTGSPLAVGGVLVLRLVPPLFAGPVGGVLADRADRRTIMVGTNLAMGGLIALVPFTGLPGLYAIAFTSEVLALVFLPARDATVPDLVPSRCLPQANGLVMASSYAAIPVGAALFSGLRLASESLPSGLPLSGLLHVHPLAPAFLFDAATFLFAAVMMAGLPARRLPARGPVRLLEGISEAVRYARAAPGIRALATGVGVAMFGGGVLFALGIGYVRQTLGGGDVEFGFLSALWGVGMALGIAAVRKLVRRGEAHAFRAAVAACGGVLVVMAFLTSVWLAFVAAVVFGTAFSVALILAVTLVQRAVGEGMRGRLLGGAHMLFRGALAAGALGVGGAATAVGRLLPPSAAIDGNQFGLLVGGGLILLGALASGGVARIRLPRREREPAAPARVRAQPEPDGSSPAASSPCGRPLASKIAR